jgi:hypothetical protein
MGRTRELSPERQAVIAKIRSKKNARRKKRKAENAKARA